MAEAEVLDELAGMPAGAELAAALHAVPFAAMPNDRMLELVRAQYRQLCHEQARMAAALVELARCDGVPAPGVVSRAAKPDPFAVHESRAALRWTRSAAEAEHALAEFVHEELPDVFASWLTGDLDRQRVRVFEQYLYGLTADQIAAVCAHAVPRAPSLTTGRLAALLRRMVIAVDPDAADRWYKQKVRARGVCAYLAPDGTVTLSGHGLPADEAEAACRRVERLAAAAQRAGHPGTVGQIRADVFLALLDGRYHGLDADQLVVALIDDHRRAAATGAPNPGTATSTGGSSDQRRGVEIRVELSTVLGLDDHPGEIPGLGPVTAPVARARVALQTHAEWRFAVVDEEGRLLGEGLTRRRPDGARRERCPQGGVVELHVTPDLLARLAADPSRAGAWAIVVEDIAARYRDRDRHLVDLDARPDDRLPTAALRRHTEIRDRTCTFAGVCRRPAHVGDQDHRLDHARGGATVAANLGPTCGQDHAVKHRAGWTVTPTESGHATWHSPLGGAYPARGEFLCSELPDPVPGPPPHPEAPPHPDAPHPDAPPTGAPPTGGPPTEAAPHRRVVDDPILRRPPPAPPEPVPPPAADADDEPPF